MPFQIGNDGGPGRPKGTTYVTKCKEEMEKGGWDRLVKLSKHKTPAIQIAALKLLAAYGYGSPGSMEIANGTSPLIQNFTAILVKALTTRDEIRNVPIEQIEKQPEETNPDGKA